LQSLNLKIDVGGIPLPDLGLTFSRPLAAGGILRPARHFGVTRFNKLSCLYFHAKNFSEILSSFFSVPSIGREKGMC